MTTISSLISRLRSARVAIRSEGYKLVVEAPEGTVTPALRAELIENKVALIAALARTPASSDEDPSMGAARREIAGLLAVAYGRRRIVQRVGLNQPQISGDSELANSCAASVHGGVS